MALPFIHKLKDLYPESEIYVICKEWVSDIYKNHKELKDVISLSDRNIKGFKNILNTGREIKSKNFDLSYTLTDSFRSAFILWLSNSPEIVGFRSQLRSIFFTRSVAKPNKLIHRSEKYLKLINENFYKRIIPRIFLTEDEKTWAIVKMKQLGFKKPTALLPFSVGIGRSLSAKIIKKWIKGSSKNYIIFGSIFDEDKAKDLIQICNDNSIISVCGRFTLRESISLIALCESSIATDSGLGHVSAALGIPTVSFFGRGKSFETSPVGIKTKVIKHCIRCEGVECTINNRDSVCIKKISRKEVEFAVNQLIDM